MTETRATQIIILGGTGDLSRRKLLPALLDLYARSKLPKILNIIGLARSDWSGKEYRDFVREAINKYHLEHSHSDEIIEKFCQQITYVSGSFDEPETYTKLQQEISNFDNHREVRSNRLFYLAVPPKFYGQIFSDLKSSGVANEEGGAWTHILVEKPFGNNLETAKELENQLSSLYREDQIFRIDHYLAKEAVQNILSFRFANTLLKAPWDKDSVNSVHISMTETIDAGGRAGFYEGIGALRDVGQNHLLQLLALVTMEEPKEFTVESIRNARAIPLKHLKSIPKEDIGHSIIRAQYDGYTTDSSVPDNSATETYFELRAEVDLPNWKGVPFFIKAGKALNKSEVVIEINLKDVATGLFETKTCLSVGNKIKLTISPEQIMSISLNAKKPGLGYQLEARELSFTCKRDGDEIKNSYEKVLYDSIIGDQTLFTSTEEVLAAWSFITPIIDMWHNLPLYTYQKGSSGPNESLQPMK